MSKKNKKFPNRVRVMNLATINNRKEENFEDGFGERTVRFGYSSVLFFFLELKSLRQQKQTDDDDRERERERKREAFVFRSFQLGHVSQVYSCLVISLDIITFLLTLTCANNLQLHHAFHQSINKILGNMFFLRKKW